MVTPRKPRPVLGLLLAGGAGRRAGGADKGLLPFAGGTLAAAVAGRLHPQVDRLVIACNRHRDSYAALGDAVVRDRRPPYQGPLAGVEAALGELPPGWLLALAPCDVPGLPPDLVDRLRQALLTRGDSVAWARDGDRDHFLCALLTARAAGSVGRYLDAGGRSVRGWYAALAGGAVDFPGGDGAFANYNRVAPDGIPWERLS